MFNCSGGFSQLNPSQTLPFNKLTRITAVKFEQFCNILRQTQHLHHLEVMRLPFFMPAIQVYLIPKKFSQMVHFNLFFFASPGFLFFLGISHLSALRSLNRWNILVKGINTFILPPNSFPMMSHAQSWHVDIFKTIKLKSKIWTCFIQHWVTAVFQY